PVTTEPLPTVTPFDTPQLRQYTRRARIAQSSALLTAADEPASPLGDGSQGEACPTITGLVAGHDRATITKTSTLPSDSTPRVTSLAAAEGSIAQSGDDASIKGRSLDEGEESAEKGSDDTVEMVTVLTSLNATTILSSGVNEVPTGSGSIPTAGPPATGIPTGSGMVPTGSGMVPTASLIFTTATETTPYTRRKGKEKMVEFDTPKKKKLQEHIDVQVARELEEEMARDAQRMNEQITKDAEIERIHAEEELNNETVAKYLQEYHQFATELPIGRRIELIKEVTKEKLKEMMQLIPVEEVDVEALQVKHPIIDWEVHTEGHRSYWKIIRLGVKETLNIRPAASDKENEL
nr:hypothetical protein [Tanacetum cinerariifolium]